MKVSIGIRQERTEKYKRDSDNEVTEDSRPQMP